MNRDLKTFVTKRVLGFTPAQIIVLLAMLLTLFFFSDSSIQKRLEQEKEIKDLESQIDYYRKQIEDDRKKLEELQSNIENLEKFARENYFMKKDDEEIFIVD